MAKRFFLGLIATPSNQRMLLSIDSRLPRGCARRSISWLPIRSRASSFLKWAIKTGGTNDAALGTDGKVVKVRYSYVDWNIPETDAKVRMGLQPFDIATFAYRTRHS